MTLALKVPAKGMIDNMDFRSVSEGLLCILSISIHLLFICQQNHQVSIWWDLLMQVITHIAQYCDIQLLGFESTL